MAKHPDALRADLQRFYGVDIDRAMKGDHTAGHIAALAANLPNDACVHVAENPDSAWTLELILLADVRNHLSALIWGMSDSKKRGSPPKRIGPSWMRGDAKRKLDARTLSIDELMKELSKPRRGAS